MPGYQVRSEDLLAITDDVPLTRGLGRAYGDAALPAPGDLRIAGSTLADRILGFNADTGDITAEAGLSLDELYRALLPRGWFTPVTPGTRFVTLGGMVAADVHGRNHHVDGCFGRHVHALRMRVADGRVVTCSRTEHADLFFATIGGMGLTGHILDVSFRMVRVPSPWVFQETQRVSNIDAFMDALNDVGRGVADDEGVDRLPVEGSVDGTRRVVPRAMGRAGRVRREGISRSECARPGAVHVSTRRDRRPLRSCLQRGLLSTAAPAFQRGASEGVLLPARRSRRLASHLRAARIHPVSVRAARIGRSRRRAPVPERGHARSAGHRSCVSSRTADPKVRGCSRSRRREFRSRSTWPCVTTRRRWSISMNECVIAEGGRIYLAKDALTRPEHFRAMESRLDAFLRGSSGLGSRGTYPKRAVGPTVWVVN